MKKAKTSSNASSLLMAGGTPRPIVDRRLCHRPTRLRWSCQLVARCDLGIGVTASPLPRPFSGFLHRWRSPVELDLDFNSRINLARLSHGRVNFILWCPLRDVNFQYRRVLSYLSLDEPIEVSEYRGVAIEEVPSVALESRGLEAESLLNLLVGKAGQFLK